MASAWTGQQMRTPSSPNCNSSITHTPVKKINKVVTSYMDKMISLQISKMVPNCTDNVYVPYSPFPPTLKTPFVLKLFQLTDMCVCVCVCVCAHVCACVCECVCLCVCLCECVWWGCACVCTCKSVCVCVM